MSLSDSAALVRSLGRLQIVTYLHVSGTALLCTDYLLTLSDEITYAWRAPWNLGKVLFFLTRYPAFVDSGLTLYHQVGYHLPVRRCIALFRVTGWLIIVGIVIAEIILVIRVWALYQRSRPVGIFLLSLSLAAIVAAAVGFVRFHSSQTFTLMDDISPHIPGCYPNGGTNIVAVDFIVLVVFETVILLMTMAKAVEHYKTRGTSSFIYMFFKDGLIYYAVLQAISLVNVVVLFSHIREYTNLVTSLQRTLHSLLSARILLHLRREAARNIVSGELTPVSSSGAMRDGSTGDIGELVFATGRGRMSSDGGRRSRWGGDTSWFGEGSVDGGDGGDGDGAR